MIPGFTLTKYRPKRMENGQSYAQITKNFRPLHFLTVPTPKMILGFIFGDIAASSKWIGDLFVRFIKMLVVPLIFTSLVAGVVSMGDPKRLGSIGIKTIVLYLMTTLFAITIGLVLGTIFSPGAGIDITGVDPYNAVQSSQNIRG